MKFLLLLTFAFCLFSADLEKGAKLYKKCTACHGNDGYGKKSQKAPMIAGQFEWYLKEQIYAIKNEKRLNNNTKKMYPYVKNLSDEDIENLSAYIASMPKRK